MQQLDVPLVRNDEIADDTFRIRVEVETIAASVLPGQFVMIRMSESDAPLIGRAFAVYDIINDSAGKPRWIDLVYLRKGTFTRKLAASPHSRSAFRRAQTDGRQMSN